MGRLDETEEFDGLDDPNDPIAFSDDYNDNLVGNTELDVAVERGVIDTTISSNSETRSSRQISSVPLPTVEDCGGSIVQPSRIPDFTGPFIPVDLLQFLLLDLG